MLNVLGPGLALDIDERVQFRLLETHHHVGRLVAWLIQKWIILRLNTAAREVLNWSNVFLIGIMLALASDLNIAGREWGLSRVTKRLAVIRLRYPTVDAVQFN